MGSTKARRTAAEWFVEIVTADDPDVLWPALNAWIEAAPENLEAYREIAQAWAIGENALAPTTLHRSQASEAFVAKVHASGPRRRVFKH